MLAVETFLVRPGSYDNTSGELTQQGMLDAAHAVEDLQFGGLAGSALVLSSDTPRTMGTAQVIAERLSLGTVVPSVRMNVGGNYGGAAIDDLDRWVLIALDEAGVTLEDKDGLVVVTHEPLISAAQRAMTGDHRADIGYGQVIKYIPGSWNSSHYNAASATTAEQKISASRTPAVAAKPKLPREPGESQEEWETRCRFAR